MNTSTGLYEDGPTYWGPWVSGDEQASVNIWWRPSDIPSSPSPTDTGAYYPVASFHTHTSTFYGTKGRDVGPSDADRGKDDEDQVPGLVYDYIGVLRRIEAGHPINAPARIYQSLGPERRPTP